MTSALIVASLLGCGHRIDGIWLVQIDAVDLANACEDTVTDFNVSGASSALDDTSSWTTETSTEASASLAFAEITTSGDGAVLVLDGHAYPGTVNDDGSKWTFAWSGTEDTSTSQAHESGYTFTDDSTASTDAQFTLTLDDKAMTMSGKLVTAIDHTETWTESDTWDSLATQVDASQMPIPIYLQTTQGDTTRPAQNTSTEQECDRDPCTLTVDTACASDQKVSATLTEEDDPYASVSDAGQPAGVAK